MVLASPLAGQSIASGTVRGMVKDSTGQPLGNVRVALTDRTSGFTHVALTPRAGRFVFPFLPPGEYDLLAERLGLLPVEVRGIGVLPSGDVELEVALEAVEPPVMERTITTLGKRLDRTAAGPGWQLGTFELRRIPDDRRDIGSAARVSTISDETLTIEGLPATYSQISVDGIAFQFPRHPLLGQTRPVGFPLPISALSGAAVDPGGVDIEWTAFTAGRVAALGTRGTNRSETRFHLDWSPVGLSGSEYSDPTSVSGNSFRGGVLLSGPVMKDTAHFVLGLDAQRLAVPVPSAWEPTGVDGSLAAATDSLGVNLTPYQTPRIAMVKTASLFGRFDWQANQQNRLAVLALGSLLGSDDPPLGYGRAVGLGTRQKSWDLGLGATLTNVLSSAFALELRVGFEAGRHEYFGNDTALTLTADGPAAWGTDPAIPGRYQRTGVRANETVHITFGGHRLKLGGGVNFGSHQDVFGYDREGTFAFGRPEDLAAVSGGFTQTVGREPIAKFTNYEFGWFLQDRWVATPGAELVFGFRMDWERVDRGALVRNAQLFARSGIATDSVKATQLKVSPRVGFNWDLGNKGTWILRADGGVYQGSVPNDVFAEAVAEGGARYLRSGTGALGSWPGAPDSVAASPAGALVSVLPYGFSAPRSTKVALGVSGALGRGVNLHLAGSFRHTQSLVRRRDLNRVPGQSGQDQYGRPIYGELEQYGSALLAAPGSGRRLDEFSMVSALNLDGVSDYFGVTARIEKRMGRRLTLSVGYTASRTSDNLTGAALGPDAQLSPFPDSLNGIEWEDGTSDFDVPQRFVLGAELRFPVLKGAELKLAGFYALRSGRPFTPGFRDGVDANADGSWRNDPAFIDEQVTGVGDLFGEWDCLRSQVGAFADRNSCRGPSIRTLDLRLALGPVNVGLGPVGFPVEFLVDAMNLLDTDFADVDRALYLVDPAGSLTQDPATGTVTVPLVANQDFGRPIRRYGQGRYLRIGIRVNYE